ncbi:hypothetical protein [Lentzea sp.]|uniref:hypothetical protein n=1 Tax=Lentzea sp. TaxID=56099 RepID=UPI002CD3675B|nr:hypothetical protein [Lentzea sp.]HUQ54323.1 hypothetical protein [Lentzea sp.]
MRTTAGLVLACVLSVSACSGQAAAPAPATTSNAVTTTSEAPGADPAAWFDAYCTPLGLAAKARNDLRNIDGRTSVKDAVVLWVSMAAVSDRRIADDVEKLGPLGSDVQSVHERLVSALREEAGRFDKAAERLRSLANDDAFPERYEQVMAIEMGSVGEQIGALFTPIAQNPRYADAFRSSKACTDWQSADKQAPGK